jgi:hypothetical protein
VPSEVLHSKAARAGTAEAHRARRAIREARADQPARVDDDGDVDEDILLL